MTNPAPAPWKLDVLLGVLRRVQDIDPASILVDAAFPLQRLTYAMQMHRRLPNVLDRSRQPHRFFTGFRDNSGDADGNDIALMSEKLRAENLVPWLVMDADQATYNVDTLSQLGLPLLVHGSADATVPALLEADFTAWPFRTAAGDWTGYTAYLLPDQLDRLSLDPASEDWLNTEHAELPQTILINPWDLMTDSSWGAEGDIEYSWLWTGPEICHRICLGHPPEEARQLAIEFVESGLHEGIAENLLFQINGHPVSADLSGLHDNGGHATVDLPEDVEAPVVLGICAFPDRVPPEELERHLRVAYDALEVRT